MNILRPTGCRGQGRTFLRPKGGYARNIAERLIRESAASRPERLVAFRSCFQKLLSEVALRGVIVHRIRCGVVGSCFAGAQSILSQLHFSCDSEVHFRRPLIVGLVCLFNSQTFKLSRFDLISSKQLSNFYVTPGFPSQDLRHI